MAAHPRRSLTWDKGAEMAQYAQTRIDTGPEIYFCDPPSPWQCGGNENTDGLLRQYVPKGADLSQRSADEPSAVARLKHTTLQYTWLADARRGSRTAAQTEYN
ncbi:hypothetical protein ATI53_100647 [Salipiger aestuarii]|uniref:Integrase-like protein n=2 Tax=Salipiger aestuarii TaxID=568098 RepID=A0A327YQ85_9RHOB|nr:hypothetical protein ATI53_100647 [Salipiger aestuarii]